MVTVVPHTGAAMAFTCGAATGALAATVKLLDSGLSNALPARSFAAVVTRMVYRSFALSAAAGAKVSTSLSRRNCPLTGAPAALSSEKAGCSVASSIGAVKETTTTTPASTATAFAAGKVWNTEGGVARRLTSTAATAVLLSGWVTRAVTGVMVVSVALPLK